MEFWCPSERCIHFQEHRYPKRYVAKGKHVRHWTEKCRYPVFLFLVDVTSSRGTWLFVQKYVKENISERALKTQRSFTLHLHPKNNLDNVTGFISAVEAAATYVNDMYPGSPKAAVEKRQRELKELDPRLSIKVTATQDVETLHVSADPPVPFKMRIRDPSARLAFKRAIESGTKCTLMLDALEFSESPFFEKYNKSKGSLLMQFAQKTSGHICLGFKTSAGSRILQVNGEYSAGTKRATFRGTTPNAPLEIKCGIGIPCLDANKDISIGLFQHLERWEGQQVLLLSHFDEIFGIYESLFSGEGVEIEHYIAGNRFAHGNLQGIANESSKGLLKTLRWLSRCRLVTKRYQINPKLPRLDSITAVQLEAVDDLAALICSAKRVMPYPHFHKRGRPSRVAELTSQGPMIVRIDTEGAKFDVLGHHVIVGNIRSIFTGVTITVLENTRSGKPVLDLRGSASTMRMLEKF